MKTVNQIVAAIRRLSNESLVELKQKLEATGSVFLLTIDEVLGMQSAAAKSAMKSGAARKKINDITAKRHAPKKGTKEWMLEVHHLRSQGLKWQTVYNRLSAKPKFRWTSASSLEQQFSRTKREHPDWFGTLDKSERQA